MGRENRKNLSGFTLVELVVVIFIMATLTGIVTVNFSSQRSSQEVSSAATDLVSKIREVQGFVLSGKIVSGSTVADAYQMTFSAGAQNYVVDYVIRISPTATSTTTLETVNLSAKMEVRQILVGANPRSQIKIRFESPYGKNTVDGASNQTVQIDLGHKSSGQTRSVIIDGISGRIGIK